MSNSFFEDFQKITLNAMQTMSGSFKHFEEMVRNQIESSLLKMNFVKRDEFEILKESLIRSNHKIEELEKKIEELTIHSPSV